MLYGAMLELTVLSQKGSDSHLCRARAPCQENPCSTLGDRNSIPDPEGTKEGSKGDTKGLGGNSMVDGNLEESEIAGV